MSAKYKTPLTAAAPTWSALDGGIGPATLGPSPYAAASNYRYPFRRPGGAGASSGRLFDEWSLCCRLAADGLPLVRKVTIRPSPFVGAGASLVAQAHQQTRPPPGPPPLNLRPLDPTGPMRIADAVPEDSFGSSRWGDYSVSVASTGRPYLAREMVRFDLLGCETGLNVWHRWSRWTLPVIPGTRHRSGPPKLTAMIGCPICWRRPAARPPAVVVVMLDPFQPWQDLLACSWGPKETRTPWMLTGDGRTPLPSFRQV